MIGVKIPVEIYEHNGKKIKRLSEDYYDMLNFIIQNPGNGWGEYKNDFHCLGDLHPELHDLRNQLRILKEESRTYEWEQKNGFQKNLEPSSNGDKDDVEDDFEDDSGKKKVDLLLSSKEIFFTIPKITNCGIFCRTYD